MIRVTLKPLWSDITFDDQDELDWLIVQGSVKSQFNPMTGSYGQIEYLFTDLRDGRPTSYPSADLDIPKAILTGAVPLVVAEAKDHGLQVIVDDAKWRVFAPKYVPAYDQLPVTLHPHQVAACDVAGQKKFGIIKAVTGGGKTYMGIAISLGMHGTNVLVLVPGPGLLKAYVKGFEESGETSGVLGDETRLVVTTYDRVASWLKKQPGPAQAYLARFRAVLADECHVCVSDGRLPVMRALINAQVRIGLSATPFDRSDKRDPLVAGVLGPRIYEVGTTELVELGHVAKADITMVAFAHEVSGSVEAMLRMKWATRYARHVVRNKERNRALLSLVQRAAKPALLFVKELEHVYEMERLIAGGRLNVRSVTGAMGVRQREGLIDDIRRGRVDVVVCTKVWSTGIDIPELASVIVGGAGKAAIDVVQTIGRGMRIADGKNTFEVWDLHDTVYTALHKQGQGRVRVYRGEGHQVNLLGDFDHKRGNDERDEFDAGADGDDGADDAA